jgi:hypothetical protein
LHAILQVVDSIDTRDHVAFYKLNQFGVRVRKIEFFLFLAQIVESLDGRNIVNGASLVMSLTIELMMSKCVL